MRHYARILAELIVRFFLKRKAGNRVIVVRSETSDGKGLVFPEEFARQVADVYKE